MVHKGTGRYQAKTAVSGGSPLAIGAHPQDGKTIGQRRPNTAVDAEAEKAGEQGLGLVATTHPKGINECAVEVMAGIDRRTDPGDSIRQGPVQGKDGDEADEDDNDDDDHDDDEDNDDGDNDDDDDDHDDE